MYSGADAGGGDETVSVSASLFWYEMYRLMLLSGRPSSPVKEATAASQSVRPSVSLLQLTQQRNERKTTRPSCVTCN